jgi:hypothetical protein
MIKGYYKERSLPGFTAGNLFVYRHEASYSLRNGYLGLSELIKPASCCSDCFGECYFANCGGLSGPRRERCVQGCKFECHKTCGGC